MDIQLDKGLAETNLHLFICLFIRLFLTLAVLICITAVFFFTNADSFPDGGEPHSPSLPPATRSR